MSDNILEQLLELITDLLAYAWARREHVHPNDVDLSFGFLVRIILFIPSLDTSSICIVYQSADFAYASPAFARGATTDFP